MLTVSQINAKLKTIAKNRDKINAELQTLAVSIIGHICEHGDTTLADRLLDAMGKGLDRQAMVLYLEDMGAVRFDKGTGKFVLSKKKRAEMEFDEDYLTSEDAPKWYEYAKAKGALSSTFDLEAKIAALLKQMAKKEESGEVEIKNAELAKFIENAIANYHSAQGA